MRTWPAAVAKSDGSVGSLGEERLHFFVLGHHPAVCGRILLRELGELLAGTIEVAPLRQVSAIRERDVNHGIGENVFEAVRGKTQFIVAQDRAVLDQDMRRRADIVLESPQRQLRGLDAATDDGAAFQY
jgi:hypothetical protein